MTKKEIFGLFFMKESCFLDNIDKVVFEFNKNIIFKYILD